MTQTMDEHLRDVNRLYKILKVAAKAGISSDATGRYVHDLAIKTIRFLQDECSVVRLKSLVPGKQYFSFARADAPRLVSQARERCPLQP